MGLTLLIIASCDPFQEDLIQKNKQVTFSQTEFYILPGLSTIIHLKAIVKQSFVNASLKISEPPSHGKLSQLDTLVLHYRPQGNFTEGRDQFSLSVLSDGAILKTQLISIIIKQKVDEFPCAVYPIQDFYLPPDFNPTNKLLVKEQQQVNLIGENAPIVKDLTAIANKENGIGTNESGLIHKPDAQSDIASGEKVD